MPKHFIIGLFSWSLRLYLGACVLKYFSHTVLWPVDLLFVGVQLHILILDLFLLGIDHHLIIGSCVVSRLLLRTQLHIGYPGLKQGEPVEDDGIRAEEILVLIDESLNEERGLVLHREVGRKQVWQELRKEAMAIDNLVHVLVVLTGLSDQVVDCLASE